MTPTLDQPFYTDGAGERRCHFCLNLEHVGSDPLEAFGHDPACPVRITPRRSTAKGHMAKKPKDTRLPGTEDGAITELEDTAQAYADARDERMALTLKETELKATALKLMKKHDKIIYKHAGIEIRVVPGEDDVKVKVAKGDDVEVDA